ncbi:MAG: hypothetical protein H6R40_1408, partial [Gemmatimonadetes bacterium]|nr:hypothetical protein [Gemmatimonadota bacterium]
MRRQHPLVLGLLLLAGCDLTGALEPEAPAARPLVGVWALTSQVAGVESVTSTCREEGTLSITKQAQTGALSWSLDRDMSCEPAD